MVIEELEVPVAADGAYVPVSIEEDDVVGSDAFVVEAEENERVFEIVLELVTLERV